MTVVSLPTTRSNTYEGVEYTVEQKDDGLFYWSFAASQLGLPIRMQIFGQKATLPEAHATCKARIDVLLAEMRRGNDGPSAA
jgi:hypothetical protein